jgi:DNA-binding transcriptional LysR family regulator
MGDAAFVWFPRRQSPVYYDRLMHECFRGGLKSPHIVQEAVDQSTILSLVSCRLGVGFVSEATRWRCPEGVVLLEFGVAFFSRLAKRQCFPAAGEICG